MYFQPYQMDIWFLSCAKSVPVFGFESERIKKKKHLKTPHTALLAK